MTKKRHNIVIEISEAEHKLFKERCLLNGDTMVGCLRALIWHMITDREFVRVKRAQLDKDALETISRTQAKMRGF